MLSFEQITLSRGRKVLLANASAVLQEKQKIGLIGNNGCGKSSLFSLLLGQITVDDGQCLLNPLLKISHLSQILPDSTDVALEFVLSGDTEYIALQQRLALATTTNDDIDVLHCHELLSQTAGYSKPAVAATIMAGLGFSAQDQHRLVNDFSGGWRMRLNLARCLMKPADLLLLDEPTNHLDMEAIFWLEKWLKQSTCSLLLISHDREFLDAVVSHILHVDQQQLTLYSGHYSAFEQLRALQLAQQSQLYNKQQLKINHLMDFVNRFRAKASKAKQAQSRLNMIAKIDIIAKAQIDSPFSFEFLNASLAANPLISCDDCLIGYNEHTPILKHVNLTISSGDRIALLGPNGQGKSTLIKALTGTLTPLAGTIHRSAKLVVGYYAQHQLEALDSQLSPVETIQLIRPDEKEQTIRSFLGGFHFHGETAVKPITHFSGGEKARLALAKLIWQKPNLLLLDEPTNHLDLTMRAAIEIALQRYDGALILISHDRHLLQSAVNDFYLVYEQTVSAFAGDLADYHRWLANKNSPKNTPPVNPKNSHRDRRNLQTKINKLEQQLKRSQAQLNELVLALSDLDLYTTEQSKKLKQLTEDKKLVQAMVVETEQQWLEAMTRLEAMSDLLS